MKDRASVVRTMRRLVGYLEDGGLLLLAVFLLPAAILPTGTPTALIIRLIIASV